ncbi:MAG TPA: DNA polymerase III subunit gamma/tau, partial [Nitrospira sp.]|nr:DNA polymerase III subunit gamma/tau [Nitrospira sp.]
ASNTSVDDVREIRENVKFTPFRGQYRVYIIDEVHMLSNSAFNALLKTLEEPPAHVVFIFATTEIHKIPATILSRCQHYNFRRISKAEIARRLRHVADQDGLSIEDRSLLALARASEGSMRDGLSLLDQIIAFGGKTIRHEDLEALLGAVPQERIRAMVEAVIQQDSAKALQVIAALLDQGHDVRAYCADLVEYVRNMLVAAVVPSGPELRSLIEATEEDLTQLVRDAGRFTVEQLQDLFRMYAAAEDSLRVSAHPRFVLETAAVRATRLLRNAEVQPTSSRPGVQPERPVADRRVVTPAPAQSQERVTPPQPAKPADAKISQDSIAKPSVSGGSASKASTAARPREVATPPAPPPAASSSAPMNAPASAASVQRESKVAASAEASAVAVEVNWEQFQDAVSMNHPNIAPFLEMGRLVKIEGGLITLGFAKQATTARSMLEKEDNLQALATLGESLYGCAVRIRIVEVAEQDPGAAPTMKQIRVAKEQEQRLILTQQAKAHPLVKQALEMFGGELAEVRTTAPAQEVQE